VKFDANIFIAILRFRWFGCEMPILSILGSFLWVWPLKCSWILLRPAKGTSLARNTCFGV